MANSKYTPAMVEIMQANAPLNQQIVTGLAELFGGEAEGFTPRSVAAKAAREKIAYERKQPTTKTGAPVERKEAIVAELARLVNANLEGLEKAPKPALQALRDFLAA